MTVAKPLLSYVIISSSKTVSIFLMNRMNQSNQMNQSNESSRSIGRIGQPTRKPTVLASLIRWHLNKGPCHTIGTRVVSYGRTTSSRTDLTFLVIFAEFVHDAFFFFRFHGVSFRMGLTMQEHRKEHRVHCINYSGRICLRPHLSQAAWSSQRT